MFVVQVDGFDQEESAGQSAFEDVQKEEGRMQDLILGPRDNYEAVMIKKINKVLNGSCSTVTNWFVLLNCIGVARCIHPTWEIQQNSQ